MAGPRQPIHLVVANGKKHLTKAEIEARKNAEVQAAKDNIRPPHYLTAQQKKEFKKIAKELIRIEILTNLDVDTLAQYIVNRDSWIFYTEMLTSTQQQIQEINDRIAMLDFELEPKEVLEKNKNKLLGDAHFYGKEQKRVFSQVQSGARDMGLTIASRCKLVIPKAPEPPKPSKFQKFSS